MANLTQGNQFFCEITAKAMEAFSLWAEANQRVLRELVDLSAGMAKEGMGLYSEIHSSAMEAVKDSQNYLLYGPTGLRDQPKDAFSCYQKHLQESVEMTQKAFRLFESNTEAVTRSAERLQVTAERAAKEIQTAFVQFGGKVRSLYSFAG